VLTCNLLAVLLAVYPAMSALLVVCLALRAPSPILAPHMTRATAWRVTPPTMSYRVVFTDRPRSLDEDAEAPGRFQSGYVLSSVLTIAAWTAFTGATLSAVPPASHALGMVTHVAPMGVVWGSFDAMSAAARIGSSRLRLPNYRRLNLGLMTSTLWVCHRHINIYICIYVSINGNRKFTTSCPTLPPRRPLASPPRAALLHSCAPALSPGCSSVSPSPRASGGSPSRRARSSG